jgi:carboxypeptidase Taq
MRRYLNRAVPTDTLGVLQDVHWSHGYVGSFPTYTLGNIMAAQFFDAALKQDGIAAGLGRADYAPLRTWLTDTIYRHGRSQTPTEALRRVTGGPLDIRPYVAALSDKVAALTREA